MFLQIDDYNFTIKSNVLQDVIENDNANRIYAELQAQGFIENFISRRYDVQAIFLAIGPARNTFIVDMMIRIALYKMHTRISYRQIPEIRLAEYKEAMEWLKDIRDGKMDITDAPILPIDDPRKTSVLVASVYEKQTFDF